MFAVDKSFKLVDKAKLLDILLFKEALNIKEKFPIRNSGLKTFIELKLDVNLDFLYSFYKTAWRTLITF